MNVSQANESLKYVDAREPNKTQQMLKDIEERLHKDKCLFIFNTDEMKKHDDDLRFQVLCEIAVKIQDYSPSKEYVFNMFMQKSEIYEILDKVKKGE